MHRARRHFYKFGPFCLSETESLLLRSGNVVGLTPKAFDTLLVLVRNGSRVVTKEGLLEAVWPGTAVEENNLTQQISALRKALGDTQEEQSYIETIPRRGYRFVAQVEEYWEDVEEVNQVRPEDVEPKPAKVPVLAPIGAQPSDLNPVSYRHSRSRLYWSVGLALFASGLVVGGFAIVHREKIVPPPAPQIRRSLAVLGFKNLSESPGLAWMSTGLAEMLRLELASGDRLRIVPGEDIARMKRELSEIELTTLSTDTLSRIRKNISADLVLAGSYAAVGAGPTRQIRLDAFVQDTITGETTASASRTGTEVALLAMVSEVAALLRRQLNVPDVPASDRSLLASLSPDLEVQRLFSEGLAKLRLLDAVGARPFLESAASKDPSSPFIHSALSSAWSALGYQARAQDEAKRALDTARNLRREDFLPIEGRYREVAGEWDRAIDIYKSLWMVFPDDLEFGLRLANAQTRAGKGKDALVTIAEMRKRPEISAVDPRIDLAEAATAEDLGDFRLEESAATRAQEKADSIGARLLASAALLRKCWALDNLGDRRGAFDAARHARETFAAAGDLEGEARSLKNMGDVVDDEGNHTEGLRYYEAALNAFEDWR